MALPKKITVNTSNQTIGIDKVNELLSNIDKNTIYLLSTISFDDLDNSINDLFNKQDGRLELVIENEKVPVIYLTNERWGEFSKTWQLQDEERNIKLPYITIRRVGKDKGTIRGNRFNVAQQRKFSYFEIPRLEENEFIIEKYKMSEPTAVDLEYEILFFSKYQEDVNRFDELMLREFSSHQLYVFPKNHPMPVVHDGISDDDSFITDIDGDRLYTVAHTLRLMGYIIREGDFDIVKTTRRQVIRTNII
jgi:hypothetical protein